MHALRMHFLPAIGLYGLARGSAAAAGAVSRQHAPYVVYRHWFLRIKRGAARLRRRRREGAGAQGKCSDNSGLHFAGLVSLRWQSRPE